MPERGAQLTKLVRKLKVRNSLCSPVAHGTSPRSRPRCSPRLARGSSPRSAPSAPEAAGRAAPRTRAPRHRHRPALALAPAPLPPRRGPAAGRHRVPRSPRGASGRPSPPGRRCPPGRAGTGPSPFPSSPHPARPGPAPPQESGPAPSAGRPDWLRRSCSQFPTGSARTPDQ